MRQIFFILACIVVGEAVAALVEWTTFRGWDRFPQLGTIMLVIYMPFACMIAFRHLFNRV
jgi:hypothetical protein